MWPDRVSNPRPLTYWSGALPTALRGPARINSRMPVLNPTIQLAVVYLYTKYERSILNDCGDIFNKKVLRNCGRTDGQI